MTLPPDETPDWSRVDAYGAARRRANLALALWRPMLAGAAGAALVIACVYVTLPKVSYREIRIPVLDVTHQPVVVPEVTMKPVTVPDITITTHSVDIAVPRLVSPPPETSAATAPRTPAERRFEDGKEWKDASVVVRGRLLREEGAGFVMDTAEGEASFFPARIGPNGPEPDPGMKDLVAPYLGDLCACSQLPNKTFRCVVSHNGAETEIRQIPRGRPGGKPTRGPLVVGPRPKTIEVSQ
jgi:hypothetical protein